jgi:hypothetical protein
MLATSIIKTMSHRPEYGAASTSETSAEHDTTSQKTAVFNN